MWGSVWTLSLHNFITGSLRNGTGLRNDRAFYHPSCITINVTLSVCFGIILISYQNRRSITFKPTVIKFVISLFSLASVSACFMLSKHNKAHAFLYYTFKGRDYNLGQARSHIAQGLGRLESSMNSFETRRTDLRRMVRTTGKCSF